MYYYQLSIKHGESDGFEKLTKARLMNFTPMLGCQKFGESDDGDLKSRTIFGCW